MAGREDKETANSRKDIVNSLKRWGAGRELKFAFAKASTKIDHAQIALRARRRTAVQSSIRKYHADQRQMFEAIKTARLRGVARSQKAVGQYRAAAGWPDEMKRDLQVAIDSGDPGALLQWEIKWAATLAGKVAKDGGEFTPPPPRRHRRTAHAKKNDKS